MTNKVHQKDLPVCVITGGSSGIGRATCLRFAANGYRIAFCGRDEGRLADAVDLISSEIDMPVAPLSFSADVSDPKDVHRFIDDVVDQFGRIDVLINNAGVAPHGTVESMPVDELWLSIETNIVSVFSTTQAVWPTMKAQHRGTIINVTSLAAVDPFPGLGAYGACKAWVETYTLAAANEGKEHGIRVLAVRPGAVSTPMLQRLFPDFPGDQSLSADQVANLIHHLTSDAMTHCNGQVFEIKK